MQHWTLGASGLREVDETFEGSDRADTAVVSSTHHILNTYFGPHTYLAALKIARDSSVTLPPMFSHGAYDPSQKIILITASGMPSRRTACCGPYSS